MDAKSLLVSAEFVTYLNFILESTTGDHVEQIDSRLIKLRESSSSVGFLTNVTWAGKLPLIVFCRQTNNTVDPSKAISYANLKEMLVFPVFLGPHINKRCGISVSQLSFFLMVDHIREAEIFDSVMRLFVDMIVSVIPKLEARPPSFDKV